MKKKYKELEVDSIGNQESTLTKEEERSISDFIRKRKVELKKKSPKKTINS